MKENSEIRSFNHSASQQVVSRAISSNSVCSWQSLIICWIFRIHMHHPTWIQI